MPRGLIEGRLGAGVREEHAVCVPRTPCTAVPLRWGLCYTASCGWCAPSLVRKDQMTGVLPLPSDAFGGWEVPVSGFVLYHLKWPLIPMCFI